MELLLLFLQELQAKQIDVPNLSDLLSIAEKCPYFNSSIPLIQSTQDEWNQVRLPSPLHCSNAAPFRPKRTIHHFIACFVCSVVNASKRTGAHSLLGLQLGDSDWFIPSCTRTKTCQKKS